MEKTAGTCYSACSQPCEILVFLASAPHCFSHCCQGHGTDSFRLTIGPQNLRKPYFFIGCFIGVLTDTNCTLFLSLQVVNLAVKARPHFSRENLASDCQYYRAESQRTRHSAKSSDVWSRDQIGDFFITPATVRSFEWAGLL